MTVIAILQQRSPVESGDAFSDRLRDRSCNCDERKLRTEVFFIGFDPLLSQSLAEFDELIERSVVDAIRKVLAEHGGFLTAYSPIARGQLADDPVLTEIGERHHVTAVQGALRLMIQRGHTVALPRSSNADRIASNLEVTGFELSDDEVARIEALNEGRRLIDPSFGPVWDPA